MTGQGGSRAPRALAGLVVAAALLLQAAAGRAQAPPPEFSFFGVKFGMTRAEIDQKWLPLSGGAYAVSSPAIRQIRPSFTHEGRLYEFTFAVEVEFPDDPAALVNIAFQEALNEKWKKKEYGLIVNLSIGRDGNQVTIINERLRDGYIKHLQGKVAALLQP
jgi:hypothetical protein